MGLCDLYHSQSKLQRLAGDGFDNEKQYEKAVREKPDDMARGTSHPRSMFDTIYKSKPDATIMLMSRPERWCRFRFALAVIAGNGEAGIDAAGELSGACCVLSGVGSVWGGEAEGTTLPFGAGVASGVCA